VRKADDFTTFTVPKVEKIRSLNLLDPKGPAQARSEKTFIYKGKDLSVTACKIIELDYIKVIS
jgi:hypothetical protein